MSVSGFHHHFKSVTSMSPLQFQKQIRLQEARRLMFGGDLDAASAGFRVGYEDPAYFSRQYKKLFVHHLNGILRGCAAISRCSGASLRLLFLVA